MIERAALTAPDMIELLAWWVVLLAVPLVLVRRWRRRRGVRRRRGQPLGDAASQAGGAAVPPSCGSVSVQQGGALVASVTGARAEQAHADPSPVSSSAAIRAACPCSGSGPSYSPRRRVADEALGPLSRYVDFHRRLSLAAAELRARLAQLREARWRVEPYPLTGERRNTFLILGETGIFVLSATYAPGHWDDVIAVSRLAGKVQALLPGYRGPVRPAICHPFTTSAPRIWHRPDDRGEWVSAWVLGGDSVIAWLLHFGPEFGLSAADLRRFDELSRADWLRGAILTAPSWPPIPSAPPPGSDG